MTNQQPAPTLPERKKSKTPLFIAIGAVAVVGIGAAIVVPQLTGGDGGGAGGEGELRTVRIGVVDESAGHWPVLQELLVEEGIDLELVNFSDYTLANPATEQGEVDLNLFQHLAFLSGYNVDNDADLQPIGGTVVVPLPVYSTEWTSIEEVPEGGEIAVPNDETNLGRALGVLEEAGLVVLTTEDGATPVIEDVDEAASRVVVTPVSADQTAGALSSVDAAVINNNFALDAGIDPESAIFEIPPTGEASLPWYNAFVTTADRVDDEDLLTITRLYHSPEVTDIVEEESGDTAIIVDNDGEELREVLAELEENRRTFG